MNILNVASLADLLSKKIVFFTGKGGVGKSVCASILAGHSAKLGCKTLLLESSYSSQLAPGLGLNRAPLHTFLTIGQNLDYINLDPRQCLHDYFSFYLTPSSLTKWIFKQEKFRHLIEAVPGILDISLLSWIFHVADCNFLQRGYEFVVVDSFATGHFIKFLQTPSGLASNFFSGKAIEEIAELNRFLHDPEKTGFIITMLCEKLIIEESIDLIKGMLKEFSPQSLILLLNGLIGSPESGEINSPHGNLLKKYCLQKWNSQQELVVELTKGINKVTPELAKSFAILLSAHHGFIEEPISSKVSDLFFLKQFPQ